MNVESINGGDKIFQSPEVSNKYQDNQLQPAEKAAVQKSSDKLDISKEFGKLEPIQAKIMSGFYNKTEVLNHVANRLNQEIPPEKFQK